MPLNGIPALQPSPAPAPPAQPVLTQPAPDSESILRLFKQAAGVKASHVRLATAAEKAQVNMPLNDEEDAVVVFMDMPENVSQEELTELMRTLKLAREQAARRSAQVQPTELQNSQQEENKPDMP